jgi:hypothetical protein
LCLNSPYIRSNIVSVLLGEVQLRNLLFDFLNDLLNFCLVVIGNCNIVTALLGDGPPRLWRFQLSDLDGGDRGTDDSRKEHGHDP